jgi:biotin carboxyl carrier protein
MLAIWQGQVIREGQVVCYLEQLGTQQPVEAEMSGEVMKVLWEDGEPVGYGDPLIAIRPSFPGIKKLT